MERKNWIRVGLGALLVVVVAVPLLLFTGQRPAREELPPDTEPERHLLYGLDVDRYRIEPGTVARGETMGVILDRYGLSARMIDRLDRAVADTFPLSKVRAGNLYTAFLERDTTGTDRLRHLAYEQSRTDYLLFSFYDDSVAVQPGRKPVATLRCRDTATIRTSLWGAIMNDSLPYALASELEDIYQWSIDFFAIQPGDRFTVVYDLLTVDTTVVGLGRIWGAIFTHRGKEYYAIPFPQGGKVSYWDESGQSLRKALLKAPLKYSRISSRFSYSRLHPVHKVYRPHTGVDYAAPTGTPVHAVADGVVTFRGWGGGGGNTLKIKHAGNLQTGYLHLRSFAKGIGVGTHVSQGDLIGYVGMTGTATGPHLDYRIWKSGKPIDPLKVPSEPSEPIAAANREPFGYVCDRILAELRGDSIPGGQPLTRLDSLPLPPHAVESVESVAEVIASR